MRELYSFNITLYVCIVEYMKSKIYSSVVVVAVLLMAVAYNSNYTSYYNCMSQIKSDTITQKGADHVSAQCRAFILEKIFTN